MHLAPPHSGSHDDPFGYAACLRKPPRQQRSKDCVSHIYSSALLLLDSYTTNQLTVEAISTKSGHSGSTISEWMDLNNKSLFVSCAARHHMHNLLSRLKISSMGITLNANVGAYSDRLLEICVPLDVNGHIALYHAWQNLDLAGQEAFLKQIQLQAQGIHFRANPNIELNTLSATYFYLVSAVWNICWVFSKSVAADRHALTTRKEVILLIKRMMGSIFTENIQTQ